MRDSLTTSKVSFSGKFFCKCFDLQLDPCLSKQKLWLAYTKKTSANRIQKKRRRVSCSAAAAACVLGSRASVSHSQIYNQAKDKIPLISSTLLTSAFHQNRLPHRLRRWRQTLSRWGPSWSCQGGHWCHGTPSACRAGVPEDGEKLLASHLRSCIIKRLADILDCRWDETVGPKKICRPTFT